MQLNYDVEEGLRWSFQHCLSLSIRLSTFNSLNTLGSSKRF